MLVLSRKEGERIRIGDDICVTIVHVAKDKVRVGVEAPLDTVILRDELRSKIPITIDSNETENKTENNNNQNDQQTNTKIAS
jgi:carbon storage regulator